MDGRIYSIDSMRIIAVAFVVSIHTNPFAGMGTYGNMVNFIVETTARFAVPFFFTVSGYFFARKCVQRDPTDYVLERVASLTSLYAFGIVLALPVFLAGTVVRAATDDRPILASVASRTLEAMNPFELFYYGTSVSEILWFLPALAISLVLISAFVRSGRSAYVLPAAIGLHGIGLVGASYTMVGDVPFQVRDPLFFGFFYTSVGYVMYMRAWRPSPDHSPIYLVATVVCGLAHLAERYTLGYVVTGDSFNHGVYSPSYTIGTALVTVSLFAFLLSQPALGTGTPLPTWGSYAVGIYVAHPPVLYVLEILGDGLDLVGFETSSSILWHLVFTPATFFGALSVYLVAHKLHIIEIGGSHLPRVPRVSDGRLCRSSAGDRFDRRA